MRETEMRDPRSMHIDQMRAEEIVELLNLENAEAVKAVKDASGQIAAAAEAAAGVVGSGGRLFYAGAGTSGRLAVVDASECPPTFGVSPETVTALLAGGPDAVYGAGEPEEDSEEAGAQDLLTHGAKRGDALLGISAAGSAPYVIGALKKAKELGLLTMAHACNADAPILALADYPIYTKTGAEAVTGSTRMKAGTAQKLVLNAISTIAMVRTGKVYENLMIHLKPSNQKLRARMIGIVCELTGLSEAQSETLLEEHGWEIRSAVNAFRRL